MGGRVETDAAAMALGAMSQCNVTMQCRNVTSYLSISNHVIFGAGKGGTARSQLNAANISSENGTERAIAAMAPAPLAAAPEQALKAEVSETASEPELLFAPDFIISQVSHLYHPFHHSPAWLRQKTTMRDV